MLTAGRGMAGAGRARWSGEGADAHVLGSSPLEALLGAEWGPQDSQLWGRNIGTHWGGHHEMCPQNTGPISHLHWILNLMGWQLDDHERSKSRLLCNKALRRTSKNIRALATRLLSTLWNFPGIL